MAELITMPPLSDTMTEGNIVAWLKNVGDSVKVGEVLAEVESDKATLEMESFYAGTLLYRVDVGSFPVNGVIAVIGKAGETFDPAILQGGTPAAATPTAPAVEPPTTPAIAETPAVAAVAQPAQNIAPATAEHPDRVKASPLAKALASGAGIDVAKIAGTGEEGRIVKRDVEAAIQQTQQTPPPAAATTTKPATATANANDYEDVQLTQMRKTIARRLSESKFSAPHFYLTMEINMDRAKAVRETLNALSPVKISFNDMVIKAVAMSLREHPAVNSSWMGEFVRTNKRFNVGVAVAIEEGLMVPVVHDADKKSLAQIATEVRELATRAKERKLGMEEMTGNTFTISNLGMFGIEEFTAIINPPDACILAVGAIAEKAVVEGGAIVASSRMKVTLSCDHRVVDGAKGAAFLQTLQSKLEEPMRLMI